MELTDGGATPRDDLLAPLAPLLIVDDDDDDDIVLKNKTWEKLDSVNDCNETYEKQQTGSVA